ncbi:MAG: DUF3352 domain-containing protein [Spirochaetales bacterium]|nr:DUF3352 domain-containing protein [Spirochaetales bacterium]
MDYNKIKQDKESKGYIMRMTWFFLILSVSLVFCGCKSTDSTTAADQEAPGSEVTEYEKIDRLLSSKTDIYLQFKSMKSFYSNFLINDYSLFGIELNNEQLENMKESTGFNMLSIKELEEHGFATNMPVGIAFVDFAFALGLIDGDTECDNMVVMAIPAADTQKLISWFLEIQDAGDEDVEQIEDQDIYFFRGKNDQYYVVRTTDDYVIVAQKINAFPVFDEDKEDLDQLKQSYINAISPNKTLADSRYYTDVTAKLRQDNDLFLYINMKALFNKMSDSEDAEGAGELFFNMFSGLQGLGYTVDYSGKDLIIDSVMNVEPDSLYPLMYSNVVKDREIIFCLKEKPVLLVTSSSNIYELYEYMLKALRQTKLIDPDDVQEKIKQLNQMLEIDIEKDLIENLAGSMNFAVAPLHEEAKFPHMVATFNLRDQERLQMVITKLEPLLLSAIAPQGGEITKQSIAGNPVTKISTKNFDLYIGIAKNNLIISIGKEIYEQIVSGSSASGFLNLMPEKEMVSRMKNDLGCMYLDFQSCLELMRNIPAVSELFTETNEFGQRIEEFIGTLTYIFSYSNFDGKALTSSFTLKTDFTASFAQSIIKFIHFLFRIDEYLVPPDIT